MRRFFAVIICVVLIFQQSVFASEFRFSPKPNKAHLIKWRNWDKDSLAEAKKQDKLILLSLSAVWCHWCHVMDETTYSDPDVIKYINENFIPIRVDSDMRPDIDGLYNMGGWPSTVILLPDGDVIDGGTYIPPDEMIRRLSSDVFLFKQDRERLKEAIEAEKSRREKEIRTEPGEPGKKDIMDITKSIASAYDKEFGGFGSLQKFPQPDIIDFLLSGYLIHNDPQMKKMITTTLDNMAKGEIYDNVQGGFFRYALKPDWSVPHYEKMLDVNSEMIRNYASAHMVFGNNSHKKIAEDTLAYAMNNLLDKNINGFYGSQDADEEYYKTKKRNGLKPPYIDPTVYTDANALMITALTYAYCATDNSEYIEIAKKAADFLTKNLYSAQDGMYHYYSGGKGHVSGFLSDNVLFGLALIDLYNVTGENIYMKKADDIADFVIGNFYDDESSHFTTSKETTLVVPSLKSSLLVFETAKSNFRAVIFLSKLYYVTHDKKLKSINDKVVEQMKSNFRDFAPPSAALYGTVLRWTIREPVEIHIVSDNGNLNKFLEQIKKLYIPEKTVKILSLKHDREKIKTAGYPLEEAVYVCSGKICSTPFKRPETLIDEAARFLKILRQRTKETEKSKG